MSEYKNLAQLYGGHLGSHPQYTTSDWKWKVANGETRLGYWEWVVDQIESSDESDNQSAIKEALNAITSDRDKYLRIDGVIRSLDVTTGHLKPQHLALLTQREHQDEVLAMGLLIPIYSEHGSIWWIGSDSDNPELIENIDTAGDEFSYLLSLVALARAKGCAYVWLDCDGSDHDELTKFDHCKSLRVGVKS